MHKMGGIIRYGNVCSTFDHVLDYLLVLLEALIGDRARLFPLHSGGLLGRLRPVDLILPLLDGHERFPVLEFLSVSLNNEHFLVLSS